MNPDMEATEALPRNRSSPRTPGAPISLLARSLVALSVLIAVLWFLAARGYWEDDAYIHLEFARSLATGHGFSFNYHVVYGDTSPLWVWLLVAFHFVIPSWLAAGKALTACAAIFTLSGVFAYARSLVRRWFHPQAAATFAATMLLVFVLNPYFGYWAFSGMEALAAVGLVCWACVLLAPRHLSWQRALIAATLAGLAPLLRPEMCFFTLLVGLLLFQRIRNMHSSLTTRIDALIAALILLVAPAISWGFYAFHVFGSVLPNTNAAKRAGPADSILARLTHLYVFGYPAAVAGCLLLLLWLAIYLIKRRPADASTSPLTTLHAGGWSIFIWTAINCLFYIANHTFVQTRYIFVTAPLLTIAVLAIAAIRWPAVYKCLLTLAVLFGAITSVTSTRPSVHNKVISDAIYADLAGYMRALPPGAPVALYAIGEPAFLSEHPVIDTGGITRPGVIPFIHDTNDVRINAWIYAQGARYQVIDHAPVPGAQLLWSRDLPTTGWYLNPRRYAATDRLQLWELP
jgi:hypothetical protein